MFTLGWLGLGIPGTIRSKTGTVETLLYVLVLLAMGGKLGPGRRSQYSLGRKKDSFRQFSVHLLLTGSQICDRNVCNPC